MDGAPAGSISDCHPNGWIQTDVFTKWFYNFVHFIKPSADDPVLLIVDGHYLQTKNLDMMDKDRDTVFPLSVSHHILSTKGSHLMLVSWSY